MKLLGVVAMLLGSVGIYCIPCSAGATGKFDGSAPFDCVPTLVSECTTEGDCRRGTPQSENLPQYFTIDLNSKSIRAGASGRSSTIARIDRLDGKIVLSGMEAARTWVLMIKQATGNMSASITGDGETFVLFGICLPR